MYIYTQRISEPSKLQYYSTILILGNREEKVNGGSKGSVYIYAVFLSLSWHVCNVAAMQN